MFILHLRDDAEPEEGFQLSPLRPLIVQRPLSPLLRAAGSRAATQKGSNPLTLTDEIE